MTEKEEKELNEMLDRIEKQHDTLRKAKGEEAPYKDLTKQDKVTVYTNDKQAAEKWGVSRTTIYRYLEKQ
ncbi:hypothetical protein ASG99_16410 [Bacillus sp. Soil768D1]|nr:hypothetical protein ASG99_16410 [Bacillus sp. Soil768D1]